MISPVFLQAGLKFAGEDRLLNRREALSDPRNSDEDAGPVSAGGQFPGSSVAVEGSVNEKSH